MSTIPKKVSDAFEELKKKYDIYLELKKINGHFYIYHATSEWDAEKKKSVVDPIICTGCKVCLQTCKFDAFQECGDKESGDQEFLHWNCIG